MDGGKLLAGIQDVRAQVLSERCEPYLIRMLPEAWSAIKTHIKPLQRHNEEDKDIKLYGIPVVVSDEVGQRYNQPNAVIEFLSLDPAFHAVRASWIKEE